MFLPDKHQIMQTRDLKPGDWFVSNWGDGYPVGVGLMCPIDEGQDSGYYLELILEDEKIKRLPPALVPCNSLKSIQAKISRPAISYFGDPVNSRFETGTTIPVGSIGTDGTDTFICANWFNDGHRLVNVQTGDYAIRQIGTIFCSRAWWVHATGESGGVLEMYNSPRRDR